MGTVGAKLIKWLKNEDVGLFLLRAFMSIFLVACGIRTFMDGAMALKKLGEAAMLLHFPLSSAFWGAITAFSFIWTGIFILLGFYFRLSVFIIFITQFIAILPNFSWWGFVTPPFNPSLILLTISLSLMFIGPGKYSINN